MLTMFHDGDVLACHRLLFNLMDESGSSRNARATQQVQHQRRKPRPRVLLFPRWLECSHVIGGCHNLLGNQTSTNAVHARARTHRLEVALHLADVARHLLVPIAQRGVLRLERRKRLRHVLDVRLENGLVRVDVFFFLLEITEWTCSWEGSQTLVYCDMQRARQLHTFPALCIAIRAE